MGRKPKQEIFKDKIAKVRRYLKHEKRHGHEYFPAPFVIEFGGSPDAGKTTTVGQLYQTFHRNGFHVSTPQEGAQYTQHISRKSPVYNFYTGIYALKEFLDKVYLHSFDLVFLDRGIFDTPTWMRYWAEKGAITEEELETAEKFFLSRLWTNHITASYYFIADPEIAIERDLKYASTDQLGESTNPESIKSRVRHYKTAFEKLAPLYPQLELIDTTSLSHREMIDTMTGKVLVAMEKQIALYRQRKS